MIEYTVSLVPNMQLLPAEDQFIGSPDTNTNRKNSVAAETFRVRAFARHLKIRAASSFGSIIFLLAA